MNIDILPIEERNCLNGIQGNLIKNNSKASMILNTLRFVLATVVFLFHFYVPLPGYQAVMFFLF
jgi:hypothetical protein